VDRSGIIVIVITIPFAFTRVSDVHGIIVVVQGIMLLSTASSLFIHRGCMAIAAGACVVRTVA
jgi:hypothetical protein